MKKRLLSILCLSFVAAVSGYAQNVTVTNADLEKFRQKRLQAEREYRENHGKLGFPSPEELTRQREQSRLDNEEIIARQKEQRLENEGGFAAQARVLRAEIISVEAQINHVASQVAANQSPSSYFTGGASSLGYSRSSQSSGIWRGDVTNRVFYGGNYDYYGRSRYGNIRQNAPGRWRGYGGYGGYNPYGYNSPVIVNNYNTAQDELGMQLQTLEQKRAGLYAEWQLLQEEARRAGIKID